MGKLKRENSIEFQNNILQKLSTYSERTQLLFSFCTLFLFYSSRFQTHFSFCSLYTKLIIIKFL